MQIGTLSAKFFNSVVNAGGQVLSRVVPASIVQTLTSGYVVTDGQKLAVHEGFWGKRSTVFDKGSFVVAPVSMERDVKGLQVGFRQNSPEQMRWNYHNWWGVSLVADFDTNGARVLLETRNVIQGNVVKHWVGAHALAENLKTSSAPTVDELRGLLRQGHSELNLDECTRVNVAGEEIRLHGQCDLAPEKFEQIVENYRCARQKIARLHGQEDLSARIEVVVSTKLRSHVSPKYNLTTEMKGHSINLHRSLLNQDHLLVLHPEWATEGDIAHELGHVMDPCSVEQFLLSGDHLSEAFADVSSYAAIGNPIILEPHSSHPGRRIDTLRYENFSEFLRASSQMHAYAGIHEGGRFFAHVFYKLSLKIGSLAAWQFFCELRGSLEKNYARVDWKNIPYDLQVSDTGRFETEFAARTLMQARMVVLQFFKDEHPEHYDEVYEMLVKF